MTAVREGAKDTAANVIYLSPMMNYVIRDKRDVVSLREEMENVESYFALIRAGYEDGITLKTDVSPDVMNAQLPKLCLQPLVENAVQHGLFERTTDGVVWITGAMVSGRIVLTVEDNGCRHA
jgi:LytS/YehU family sensor histidine kinase